MVRTGEASKAEASEAVPATSAERQKGDLNGREVKHLEKDPTSLKEDPNIVGFDRRNWYGNRMDWMCLLVTGAVLVVLFHCTLFPLLAVLLAIANKIR